MPVAVLGGRFAGRGFEHAVEVGDGIIAAGQCDLDDGQRRNGEQIFGVGEAHIIQIRMKAPAGLAQKQTS